MKIDGKLITPDDFIPKYAEHQEQIDFFNSLTEKEKDHVRTYMRAFAGYSIEIYRNLLREHIRFITPLDQEPNNFLS